MNRKKIFNFTAIFIILLLLYRLLSSSLPLSFKHQTIQIQNKIIDVQIADTPKKRAQGLMNRKNLGENNGMLFIFKQPQPLSFWMKNTLIDLDIAFFDQNRRCINIQKMKRLDETSKHQSLKKALYALEMNKNWFHHHLTIKNQCRNIKFTFLKNKLQN